MASARLELGGRNGRDIVFRGNKKYLPARIRGVISAYFSQWNSLRDVAQYPQLVSDLGDAGAERHFIGTDWEKLNDCYKNYMQRLSLVFGGGVADGKLWFNIAGKQDDVAPSITKLIDKYCDSHGRLLNNFDIWRLEKLLRRQGAKIEFDPSFAAALQRFGIRAISIEESISFYRQIQAYHSPQFLDAKLRTIIEPAIDQVHTLNEPTNLAALAAALKSAGADLRIDTTVEHVVAHHLKLGQAAVPLAEYAAKQDDPRIAVMLGDSLRTELYPFQREGVAFLTVNGRALLADDMGLGKTLQAIAATLCLKRRGKLQRALVVCPASLKYQWQAEIQRFTGESCEIIGGDKRERERIYSAAAATGGFVAPEDMPLFYVVNYELVYRDIAQLKKLNADLLILDEAQRVKNFRTKTNKAVLELKAPFMFVLTGTPLENQLMELYTIVRMIDDSILGKNPLSFRDRYVILDAFGGIKGYQRVGEVARKIASVTLRRTREQTLAELPPRVENNVWVELSEVQQKIYKELQGQVREVLSDAAWDSVKANNAMTLLQRLREVCDTPELIDPDYADSPKLNELMALIADEVQALDRQVIVFTQWTRVGEIIKRELLKAGYTPGFLHGGLKPQERATLVERFQTGKDRIFISTDAGGTGLNLQAASLVVNFDLPFNPAKLSQRIARAHRLGQENTVFVANLLCRGTVEGRLLKILRSKQNLFDDVFGEISDPDQVRTAVPKQRSLRNLLRELVQ